MASFIRALVRAAFIVLAIFLGVIAGVLFGTGERTAGGVVAGVTILFLLVAYLLKRPAQRHPDEWYHLPPTIKQLDFASRLGIPVPNDITRGELSELIDAFKQRGSRGR